MGQWLFATSLLYVLGIGWYRYSERGHKKRIFIVPIEFWFAILSAILIGLYVTKIQKMFLFQSSPEKTLFIISGIIGFIAISVHAIAKYYDDRCDISHWSGKRKILIRLLHFEISHYLIYISICGLLVALSSAEDNRRLIFLTDPPSTKLLASSGLLFSYAFYKTILYGNTLPIETILLPFVGGVLFKKADLAIQQTVFQYFSLTVFTLTSGALIYKKILKGYLGNKLPI